MSLTPEQTSAAADADFRGLSRVVADYVAAARAAEQFATERREWDKVARNIERLNELLPEADADLTGETQRKVDTLAAEVETDGFRLSWTIDAVTVEDLNNANRAVADQAAELQSLKVALTDRAIDILDRGNLETLRTLTDGLLPSNWESEIAGRHNRNYEEYRPKSLTGEQWFELMNVVLDVTGWPQQLPKLPVGIEQLRSAQPAGRFDAALQATTEVWKVVQHADQRNGRGLLNVLDVSVLEAASGKIGTPFPADISPLEQQVLAQNRALDLESIWTKETERWVSVAQAEENARDAAKTTQDLERDIADLETWEKRTTFERVRNAIYGLSAAAPAAVVLVTGVPGFIAGAGGALVAVANGLITSNGTHELAADREDLLPRLGWKRADLKRHKQGPDFSARAASLRQGSELGQPALIGPDVQTLDAKQMVGICEAVQAFAASGGQDPFRRVGLDETSRPFPYLHRAWQSLRSGEKSSEAVRQLAQLIELRREWGVTDPENILGDQLPSHVSPERALRDVRRIGDRINFEAVFGNDVGKELRGAVSASNDRAIARTIRSL